jgi:hypothetical protein
VKAVLRGKSEAMSTYIKDSMTSHMNNLMVPLKDLEKQNKPKNVGGNL